VARSRARACCSMHVMPCLTLFVEREQRVHIPFYKQVHASSRWQSGGYLGEVRLPCRMYIIMSSNADPSFRTTQARNKRLARRGGWRTTETGSMHAMGLHPSITHQVLHHSHDRSSPVTPRGETRRDAAASSNQIPVPSRTFVAVSLCPLLTPGLLHTTCHRPGS
jgi:hypothetical protein